MDVLDLSEELVGKHCAAFTSLRKVPDFSVSECSDVKFLLFKRKDKYIGVRSGLKTDFKTREEFLIYSVLLEEIEARVRRKLSLECLEVGDCSIDLLRHVCNIGNKHGENIPPVSDVEQSYKIVNNSELNWVFLVDGLKYHSVFWNESESGMFSRCA